MSVGLTLRADLPKGGLLKRVLPADGVLADIARAILAHVRKVGLGDVCRVEVAGGELLAFLHPAAPAVSVSVAGGELVCTAETSPAGPGYHAFVEEVMRATPLAWTGGGRGRIREDMHAWLREVFREALELGAAQAAIAMPLDLVPAREGVMSALGPWSFDWVRRAVAAPPAELATLADEFFPWPAPGLDGAFWSGLARAFAWLEVPWRPPLDDDEARIYRAAINAALRARAEDPRLELPFVDELKRMLAARGKEVRPATQGVGFRRGDLVRSIGSDWRIDVPGYFRPLPRDGTIAFGYADREVRLTPMTIAGKTRFGASDFEKLLDSLPGRLPSQPTDERILFEDPPRHGRALLQRNDAEISWALRGAVHAGHGALCAASIHYTDITDRPWAESTFRSLRPTPVR